MMVLKMVLKKATGTKKCEMKQKLKFQDYQNCVEATQLKNEIIYLEKNKIDVNSLRKNKKDFIKTIA